MGIFLCRIMRAFGKLCSWLGYLTVTLEVLALAALYFQAFVHTPVIETMLLSKPQSSTVQTPTAQAADTSAQPGWIVPLLAAVAIVAVGYGIFRLVTKDVPEAKEKAEEAVQKVARQAIKKIEKDKKLTPKRERTLTARAVFWLKIFVCLLPLIVVLALHNVTASLSSMAATLLLSGLALSGVVWFTLERTLWLLSAKG